MIIVDGVLLGVTSSEAKGDLVIPNSVRSIGNSVFGFCSDLKSVIIPDSVTSIGDYAFEFCYNMESVIIGNGVKSIGRDVFNFCSDLTRITIPSTLTSIGRYAFYDCSALTSKVANYKAFDITYGKLNCLGRIYSEGEKSSVEGELKLCTNGIHYCTNLFEIFNYYAGELDKNIAIYECDVSDENIGEEGTSKRCARWIIPRKRLYREDVIRTLNGGE